MHQFWDRGGVIPPVQIPFLKCQTRIDLNRLSLSLSLSQQAQNRKIHLQDINIRRSQPSQRILHRHFHRFRPIPSEIRLDLLLLVFSIGAGELGRDDHLVPTVARGQPLPEPLLRFPVLVAVGGIYEVAAEGLEGVEDGEGRLFAAFAHPGLVGLAEIHGA